MKLTIERATLLKALGHVQAVVERKYHSDPVQCPDHAGPDGASFAATDLDIEILESAPKRPATGRGSSPRRPIRCTTLRANCRTGRMSRWKCPAKIRA